MICAKCKTENPGGLKFCNECGAPFKATCASCGFENAPAAKFCGQCGAALGAVAATASAKKSHQTPIRQTEALVPENLEGERKTVTTLFADIKGSMELIEDLDPEEARAIVDPALKLMIETVHHYCGYVAQSTGDGIFALFGAPVAHEDHPQRALYAALRMQEELKRYSDRIRAEGRLPIQARVGVNTGEVVVRSITTGEGRTEYVPVGHSTGIAARMQALAPVGSIAATEQIRKPCEGYFLFKSLGPTKVKGVSEPVNVYEVTGLGPIRTRLQRSAGRGYTRFVGREREMEVMRRALELAKQGQGQVVAVIGEPGVGKSRLVFEFKAVVESGSMVLETLSASHGKACAFLPVIDLLYVYFKIASEDDPRARREKINGKVLTLDRTLEDTIPYLFSLLGLVESDDPLTQMDPQLKKRRTLEAIKRILLRESLSQPLLVIFEDLHWIDDETQAFLNLLADSMGTARILLLVNYRPEYRHEWGHKTYYAQLRLDPLGKESADEMLNSRLGSSPELGPLKRLIIDTTEGNPLFMEETVELLLEEGALARNGGIKLVKPLTGLRIPPTVQDILASRIDRLPASEKELLQTLAVIGKEFRFALAREVIKKPDDELNRMLNALQLGEFVYEQPAIGDAEYTFKHALTREVAYNSVLVERRKALHQSIANALEVLYMESLDDHLNDLAYHYEHGSSLDKAIHYLWRAADRASRRSLYSETLGYLNRGLSLISTLPESETRLRDELRMQMSKGAALMAARGFAFEEVEQTFSRACELARQVKDPYQEFGASRGLWGFHYTRGDAAKAWKVARDSMAVAPQLKDVGLLQYAHYALGASLQQTGKPSDARQHLETALALGSAAKLHGEPALVGPDPAVLCLTTLSDVLFSLGYPDQALRRAYEATEVVKRDIDPFSFAMALTFVVSAHCARGEAGKGEQLCQDLIELCDRYGFPFWMAIAKRCRFWAATLRGQWEEAIAMMNEQFEAPEARDREADLYYLLPFLAEAYGHVGKFDLAFASLDQWLQLHARHPIVNLDKVYYRIRGELLLRAGSLDEAEKSLRRAIQLSVRNSARTEQLRTTTGLARLLCDTNRRDEARAMLAEIYNWFTEGFDTADLKDAKALLDELSA